ncbi:MAG: thioredoxin family protein [Cytophagaceae bacterium]|jgi:hypothetical protein|nr:thioredoxin family protein [Cytophagaceae bacterium]
MIFMKQRTKEQLVTAVLDKAMSYAAYRKLIDQQAAQNSTSGPVQTEALAQYTMLNQRRMKRLDKTLKLSEAHIAQIKAYDTPVIWLVLTETWCGDAAQSLPMMHKIAQLNPLIDLKIVFRDQNLELMDAFLYRGGRSIPKLIAFDPEQQSILGEWGPRPTQATKLVDLYKEEHGSLTPEFKQDLQLWYTKDRGQDIASDLLELLP